MTQCEMVLDHLKTVGGITAAEAMQQYGIYRLAARIADLKKRGHGITTRSEKSVNRFGKEVRYERYFLSDNDKG